MKKPGGVLSKDLTGEAPLRGPTHSPFLSSCLQPRIDTPPFFVHMYVPFTAKWHPICLTSEERKIDESSYRMNEVLIKTALSTPLKYRYQYKDKFPCAFIP